MHYISYNNRPNLKECEKYVFIFYKLRISCISPSEWSVLTVVCQFEMSYWSRQPVYRSLSQAGTDLHAPLHSLWDLTIYSKNQTSLLFFSFWIQELELEFKLTFLRFQFHYILCVIVTSSGYNLVNDFIPIASDCPKSDWVWRPS